MSRLATLFATSASLVLALGCGGTGISQTRMPATKNPTRWSFDRPIADVVQCLKKAEGTVVADRWGGAVHPSIVDDEVVDVPGQRYELTLDEGIMLETPRSESYLHETCPLRIYGHWRVRATAASEQQTVVDVTALRLAVHNFDCVYIGHPWGCATPVQATTVEEYTMLVSVGSCLGVQLPPVVHPPGKVPDPKTCDY